MAETVLQTQNLTKKYGKAHAAENLNVKVDRGDIYGLVGKNGAGKTTLLKMITGLAFPTTGSIELFGQTSGGGLERARSRTGSIIEIPGFFPYLSAERNLEYYRIQRGIPDESCVPDALRFVGLSDTGSKKFKNFSLGMKQRLGLALAVMGDPDMLILDEPINGLDPTGIAEFREIIMRLNQEKSTTVIISSHILGELSQIATTYGFIDNGRLLEQISSAALSEKCKSRLIIKVDDTQKAAAVLEKGLGCKNFKVVGKSEIRLAQYLDHPETVNRALIMEGVLVTEFKLSGLSLEDYFIKLIGGSIDA